MQEEVLLIPVSTHAEAKILFHALEHVTVARDWTTREERDFKQVADLATRPSDDDYIISGLQRARCMMGYVAHCAVTVAGYPPSSSGTPLSRRRRHTWSPTTLCDRLERPLSGA